MEGDSKMKSNISYSRNNVLKNIFCFSIVGFTTIFISLGLESNVSYYSLERNMEFEQSKQILYHSEVSFKEVLQESNIEISRTINTSHTSFTQAKSIDISTLEKTSNDYKKLDDSSRTSTYKDNKDSDIIGNSTSSSKNISVTTPNKLLGVFTATAYDASVGSNTAIGINVKGKSLEDLRLIAVDPKVIPLRTKVYVEFPSPYGYLNGIYLAGDTGSAIKGNKIDVYWGDFGDVSPQSLLNFGVRKGVKIYSLT